MGNPRGDARHLKEAAFLTAMIEAVILLGQAGQAMAIAIDRAVTVIDLADGDTDDELDPDESDGLEP